MQSQKWQGIVRHVITLVAGLLIAFGVQEDLVEQGSGLLKELIGIIVAIAGFVASWLSKKTDQVQTVVKQTLEDSRALIETNRVEEVIKKSVEDTLKRGISTGQIQLVQKK